VADSRRVPEGLRKFGSSLGGIRMKIYILHQDSEA
jgi:hypothetical protein